MQNRSSVGVIVVTHNAKKHLAHCLPYLLNSELCPRVLVVNSSSNDGTVEGIRHDSGKFFSVQFHPEATPGPEDEGYLFDEFLGVVGIGRPIQPV